VGRGTGCRMDKPTPQTLAEYLGVVDPITKAPAPDAPTLDFSRLTVKDFAKHILASAEYRASVLRRIMFDELPPAIEALLYHYAHGKPVERVEVNDVTLKLEDLTTAQLEERALLLARLARSLREREQPEPETGRSATVN
jgi:hypothetical protein